MKRMILVGCLLAGFNAPAAFAAEWQTYNLSGAPQGFGFSTPGTASARDAVSAKLFAAPVAAVPAFGASPFAGGSLFSTGTSARYADKINDKWLLGIETSTGFAASSPFGSTFRGQGFGGGFDYNATNVRLGYDLGAVTPYISSSIASTKPNLGLGATPFETGFLAQNPSFSAKTTASVGAGINYQATQNLQFSAGVSIGNDPRQLGSGFLGQ